MAVQAFLNSNFYYFERSGVSSVETILDDVKTQVLANSPAWTVTDNRPGIDSILCTSPADAFGRFFDVLLTNVAGSSNLKLECRVRDQNAVTVATRRINATSANTWTVRIYTGQYHFVIDVDQGSVAPEALFAGILDLSPEAQNAHTHYVYGGGSRSSADALGTNDINYAAMVDNVTATLTTRVVTYPGSNTGTGTKTPAGSWLFRPRMVYATPTGGSTFRYAGRMYQQLIADSSITGIGGKFTVPIDIGATGVFRQVGGIVTLSSMIMYCRVA